MIVRTWKPDLCGCKFQITKDFDLEKVIDKCNMHNALADNACFTTVIQNDKDINLTPKLKDETDEEYQDRRWILKDAAIKANRKKRT